MRNVLIAAAFTFGALSMFGCKRTVPQDIVQKSIKSSLSKAPMTGSGMCGETVQGIANATVTLGKRGQNNTGVAHVKGQPLGAMTTGGPPMCEGDIEYAYSYTSKTTGFKRKTTKTTWYLDKIKLVGVQTKGVTFKPVEETASDPDDNQ